ncbi:protein disulfide oxidoreductase DsbA [Erwinia amylovora]|uniref:Thiol:disulfide interchange protein n=3 Tax=Erwinia amylovora TaxID=552 RepID=A0A830ZZ81_ERWAM|nr:protein disulfide oxidoreductase DsbA [Erwinia amylovora]CDK14380.1 Thiol:disulfide interchange protein dsbA precursor [Erwinia amylovora LA635]CDK17747.1 Thiol:disulfide interchange protein dsbA precursor [Erwinia amylovora LA636]CDK21116.1 Thiol:disulfide interchange protein dsbA precursor [Erwinia amylovora LA637]ATZ12410.1 protein disulfide oxidoreductase DsbA [Erwinia amylovora]EKV55083.1 Thiol:disulfide interchange protein dsbA precursor [Erwinia amylovora ACW56400]
MFTQVNRYLSLCLFCVSAVFISPANAAPYKENDQYFVQQKSATTVPDVVEFFSFYCGPCFQFSHIYKVTDVISENLPSGTRLTKYHVGLMGPLGHELTEAWSVAMVLGIEHKVEKLLFEKIQQERSVNSVADIMKVFSSVGVEAGQYENTRRSLPVQALVKKQDDAVETLNVTSTPSFYVSGKYRVNNAAITSTSADDYAKEFAGIIRFLLEKQP